MKFKKIVSAIIIAALALQLVGCGQPLTDSGREIPTYGLLNAEQSKNSDYNYEISIGNVIWGIVLIETIAAPIYFFGFSLYNPVSKKSGK
jgi:hypothetical protein